MKWSLKTCDAPPGPYRIVDEDGVTVCVFPAPEASYRQSTAEQSGVFYGPEAQGRIELNWTNGLLIAAAPDMLHALKAVRSYVGKYAMEQFGSYVDKMVLAAIAKAEGRDK